MAQETVGRVVAVGASNLTRGFHTVVATARGLWGPEVEVLAALGHGRSYGATSTYLIRTLPGILHSGLWRELESRPRVPTRALVTDVGNDILYGSSPAQILAWVDECVTRLQRVAQDVVITGLPFAAVDGLSPRKFLLFRSVFFPRCRMTLDQTIDAARQVETGLTAIAGERGLRLCPLKHDWYGLDPIHIRPRMWSAAWQDILCGQAGDRPASRGSGREALRLYCLQPEQASFLGLQRRTPQRGVALRAGGRVWLS
jgi:hypothetical protein